MKVQEIEMNNGQANLTNYDERTQKNTKVVRKEIGTTYKTTCDDESYKSKAQNISTMVVVFCNQCH
jgi:hypothetical protein